MSNQPTSPPAAKRLSSPGYLYAVPLMAPGSLALFTGRLNGPWLHAATDAIIGVCCLSIAASLAYFIYRTRNEFSYSGMLLGLGSFFAAIGLAHLIALRAAAPDAGLEGDIKLVAAAAALFVALALLRQIPRIAAAVIQLRKDDVQRLKLESENRGLLAAQDKHSEFDQMRSQLFLDEASSVALWEWTLATDEVVYAGDVGAIFGHTSHSSSLHEFMERVHPDDRVALREAIDRAIIEQAGFDTEFRTVRPSGAIHWLVGRGRVHCDAEGRPVRMLGVSLDVTQRKQAERALRNSEKLAATGRLAAIIAHEINNPLESITNIMYLLQQDSSLDEKGKKYVAMAQEELQRMAHITRETLGFYRDSSAPVPVHLHEVVQSVVDVYQRRIYRNHVKISTHYETDRPVAAFPGEMRQVISNLLLNAIEVVPESGQVSVRVSSSCDWRNMRQGGVRVTIVDNGPGIAGENKKRIFDPFFTTKGEKGSGLGLWVSQGIVSRHGGSLTVHSSLVPPRQGAAFSLFIPG